MNISVVPPRHVGDPGAPRLRADTATVLAVAAAVALVAVLGPGGRVGDVAVLGACLVAAELLVVQLTDGSTLPLSLAVLFPLLVAVGPGWIALVTATAVVLAAPGRRPRAVSSVAADVASRTVAVLSGWSAHRGVTAAAGAARPVWVLAALAAASLAVLAVELVARRLRREGSFAAAGGYSAFFAVAASGILMAVAYDGVAGRGAIGLWGVPVFAVPALSARWAFGRLHAIHRTYDQTIHVLSVVPEMGGRVRPGHSRRVADLAVDVARMLDLPRASSVDLERAALLHALGSVTLEDPDAAGTPGPHELAGATAAVLRDEARMSGPAGLVARMAGEPVELSEDDRLASEILSAAAAYEHATGGDPTRARPALDILIAPPPGGDRRVLAALTRVVTRRGIPGC